MRLYSDICLLLAVLILTFLLVFVFEEDESLKSTKKKKEEAKRNRILIELGKIKKKTNKNWPNEMTQSSRDVMSLFLNCMLHLDFFSTPAVCSSFSRLAVSLTSPVFTL